MAKRTRYVAKYLFPGSFVSESTTKMLYEPTLEAAINVVPETTWFSVKITEITEVEFTSTEDIDSIWVPTHEQVVRNIVIGDLVHVDDIEDNENNSILRSNLLANTSDGYAVHTRAGNWQFAQDYDEVVSGAHADRIARSLGVAQTA